MRVQKSVTRSVGTEAHIMKSLTKPFLEMQPLPTSFSRFRCKALNIYYRWEVQENSKLTSLAPVVLAVLYIYIILCFNRGCAKMQAFESPCVWRNVLFSVTLVFLRHYLYSYFVIFPILFLLVHFRIV